MDSRVAATTDPGRHPESGKVEGRVHHPRAVGLADQAVVRIEQQGLHRERLAQVSHDPAHVPIVAMPDRRGHARRARSD